MGLEKVTQFKFGTFFRHHVDPVIVCTHLEGSRRSLLGSNKMIKYALLDAVVAANLQDIEEARSIQSIVSAPCQQAGDHTLKKLVRELVVSCCFSLQSYLYRAAAAAKKTNT